jgi:hypothetical protein
VDGDGFVVPRAVGFVVDAGWWPLPRLPSVDSRNSVVAEASEPLDKLPRAETIPYAAISTAMSTTVTTSRVRRIEPRLARLRLLFFPTRL